MQNQLAASAIIRCVLKPHHSLLRKEVERAADLTASVVLEQRPPLCRTLLPLHRLFQEFHRELEGHLEVQDTRLFPQLLDLEAALSAGDRLLPRMDDVPEALRLLRHGWITLTSVLDEMRELTHGFTAPPEACECYGELLDILEEIQMEIASEMRMEGMLFPQAAELLQLARRCEANGREHAGKLRAMHAM
jgi:regulator of cell morphogenesis and NO signaling